MSFIGRIKDVVKSSLPGWNMSNPSWDFIKSFGGFGPSSSGVAVGVKNALTVAAVYACVRNIAEDVAKLPVTVWQVEGRKRRIWKRHPLYKVLKKPNRFQNTMEFFEMMTLSLALRGNAYAAIIRNFRGDPIALIPIHPDRITLLEVGDELFYQIASAGTFLNAQLEGVEQMACPQRDMLHVKLASFDGLMGLSPIQYARESVGEALAQQKYQGGLMANGAKPAGILTHPKALGKEVADRLKQQWDGTYSNLANAGKTIVLEEGMKWEKISLSPADTELLQSRYYSVEEICRFWRTPPHKIGHLLRSTNNNIEKQDQQYLNDTLSSYTARFEYAFNDKFGLDEDDAYIEFDTDDLMRMDPAGRYKAYRDARAAWWITTNEIRFKEGLDPKEGGDEIERPNNIGGDPEDGTGGEQAPEEQKPEVGAGDPK